MTKDEYLQKNILELLENPQLEQMTSEARAMTDDGNYVLGRFRSKAGL